MKKKYRTIITGILVALLLLPVVHAETPRYMHVTSITMEPDGANAIFTVRYELDFIARFYVLFLGSGNIEPAIYDLFYDFENVKITNIRKDYAVIRASNVSTRGSEQMGGFYYHDSHKLGTTVDSFTVIFPNGGTKTFFRINATPNAFFEI